MKYMMTRVDCNAGQCRSKNVTRDRSHVTRHTSHVTRHTSHVTRHTSHVTRHTSHVTHSTLSVLCPSDRSCRRVSEGPLLQCIIVTFRTITRRCYTFTAWEHAHLVYPALGLQIGVVAEGSGFRFKQKNGSLCRGARTARVLHA